MTSYEHLPKRYRLDDPYLDGGTPELTVWYVVRKTPAGAWIAPRWAVSGFDATTGQGHPWGTFTRDQMHVEGARFVLDGNGKRFAHETERWARDSYKIRKLRQIQHAKRAIERAENALHWLKTGKAAQSEVVHLAPFNPTGVNGYAL